MSRTLSRDILLPSPDATVRFAAAMAPLVRAGDTLLLDGPLGAGKTLFARALIQTRLAEVGAVEDVPSPTYTLVQTYQAGDLEIWHADLYRIGDPDEIFELGLDGAFETALTLIEWPDRLGALAPPGALWLRFRPDRESELRRLTLSGPADRVAGLGVAFDAKLADG